jgi:hypothetical protein
MSCDIRKIPLKPGKCIDLPGLITSMIVTSDDFKATPAQIGNETFWQNSALQQNGEFHIWPYFDMFENISEEAVYEDTPLSYLNVRDGNYRFKFHIAQGLCLHKAMFTHRAKSGRAFLFDNEGNLMGTKDSAGNFYGFSIQLLNTEKLVFSDGSVATKSPIVLALRNNKELDRNGYMLKADWFYTLPRIQDVTIAGNQTGALEITFTVTSTCDGTPITGLVLADFQFFGTVGTPAITAGANPGQYILTGASMQSVVKIGLSAPTLTKPYSAEVAKINVT